MRLREAGSACCGLMFWGFFVVVVVVVVFDLFCCRAEQVLVSGGIFNMEGFL